MRHRMTLTSNPRLILFILLLAGLPAAGVLLIIFAGVLIGVIALAAAAYLDYTVLRFFKNHLKSWVETNEQALSCQMPDGDLLSFPWGSITIAGYATQERGHSFLFVYDEQADKLVIIPKEYSDFDALHEAIRARTPYRELSLSLGETIQERLKADIL